MKRKLLLIGAGVLAMIFTWNINVSHLLSNNSGAPTSPKGATGSPIDGRSCADLGCHATSAPEMKDVTITLPSDLLTNGYEPDEVYSVTVSTTTVNTEYGFQITAEASAGGKQGIFNTTGGTTVKIVGGGLYATHNGPKTGGGSWTFTWKAPPLKVGDITFYAAVNAANNDGLNTGDSIRTGSITIMEDTTAPPSNINEIEAWQHGLMLYPNPATDIVTIDGTYTSDEDLEVELFDIYGRLIQSKVIPANAAINTEFDVSQLRRGTYLVRFRRGERKVVRRFVRI